MKGWELLKEIAEGNVKEGTKFKMMENNKYFYYDGYELRNEVGRENILACHTITAVTQFNFEIIEEQEENKINIQDIKTLEELAKTTLITNTEIMDKTDELIKAIKQLDKEIKEIKND